MSDSTEADAGHSQVEGVAAAEVAAGAAEEGVVEVEDVVGAEATDPVTPLQSEHSAPLAIHGEFSWFELCQHARSEAVRPMCTPPKLCFL